ADGSSPGIAYVEDYGLGMGGPPWGARQPAYIAQSPLYQLDRINTPLLLIHGEADEVVPSAFSGEVFVGLRRLGKPVVIALYGRRGTRHRCVATRKSRRLLGPRLRLVAALARRRDVSANEAT
ncbi:MAG TPA: prolyl oligopeptidase family serine peptidase, partial [Gemmatimonadaceae bacterium]|nr:prolyl oligopeptidase family serine peptidase [Gemmatimonadaceae bacterium]